MKRLVRAESRRLKPAAIKAHEWTGEQIRANPDEAFELFDYRKRGKISVAELLFTVRKTNKDTKKRGSIFDEMKLFELLDVDGDAEISKGEFKDVVSDPSLFSDEALAAIAKMATRRATEEATKKKEPADDVDADAMEYEAVAAATGLVHGKQVSLKRSQSMNDRLKGNVELAELSDDCDVIIELYAIGLGGARHAWYEFFKQSSDPYVVITGVKFGERVALGETSTFRLVGAWDPVILRHADLAALDEPYRVTFDLFDANNAGGLKIGSIPNVDLGASSSSTQAAISPFDHASEVAIGPLPCLTDDENVNAKILGMRKWVKNNTRAKKNKRSSKKKTTKNGKSCCYFDDTIGFYCCAPPGDCDAFGSGILGRKHNRLPTSSLDDDDDDRDDDDDDTPTKKKLDFLFHADNVRAQSRSPGSSGRKKNASVSFEKKHSAAADTHKAREKTSAEKKKKLAKKKKSPTAAAAAK